jgi:predicted nucleic acid-binding protein
MRLGSTMIVDANIAVYWSLPGVHLSSVAAIMERSNLCAPELILLECENAFLKHARMSGLPSYWIRASAANIEAAIENLIPDRSLLADASAIALEHNHKIYDCLYLALARRRGEPLATADRRLALLAGRLSIPTELIEPSL